MLSNYGVFKSLPVGNPRIQPPWVSKEIPKDLRLNELSGNVPKMAMCDLEIGTAALNGSKGACCVDASYKGQTFLKFPLQVQGKTKTNQLRAPLVRSNGLPFPGSPQADPGP